jgi:hypothetical protein
MSLFDQVGSLLGNGDLKKYQAILSWVESQGGVQALLDKLRNGGLGEVIASWLSDTLANQLISGDQVTAALGTPAWAKSWVLIPERRLRCWPPGCQKRSTRFRPRGRSARIPVVIYSPPV